MHSAIKSPGYKCQSCGAYSMGGGICIWEGSPGVKGAELVACPECCQEGLLWAVREHRKCKCKHSDPTISENIYTPDCEECKNTGLKRRHEP